MKVTLNNRFRCPFCRNTLRLHLLPLLLVVALVWAVIDLPVILYGWEPHASASMWLIAFVCVLDAFVFLPCLLPYSSALDGVTAMPPNHSLNRTARRRRSRAVRSAPVSLVR